MKLFSLFFPASGRPPALARLLGAGVLALGLAGAARAGTDAATARISSQALGGGEFDYTIQLTNTGTNNLETFWFSWVPGEDFLPVSPTEVLSPADWTFNITHGGPGDGFAIQWLTSGSSTPAPLTPGSSLTFSFESTATPQQVEGTSGFFPGQSDLTAFVYSGAPFSDSGSQFTVQAAPEPSAAALGVVAVLALGAAFYIRGRIAKSARPRKGGAGLFLVG